MEKRLAREHPEHPITAGNPAVIAHLEQTVQAWMDSDRVLPADGMALMAMLDRVQAGLAGEDAAAVRAGIAAFAVRVQALIAAGRLEIGNDPPSVWIRGWIRGPPYHPQQWLLQKALELAAE